MPDEANEVIKWLEYCANNHEFSKCFNCPYFGDPNCSDGLLLDAAKVIRKLVEKSNG